MNIDNFNIKDALEAEEDTSGLYKVTKGGHSTLLTSSAKSLSKYEREEKAERRLEKERERLRRSDLVRTLTEEFSEAPQINESHVSIADGHLSSILNELDGGKQPAARKTPTKQVKKKGAKGSKQKYKKRPKKRR